MSDVRASMRNEILLSRIMTLGEKATWEKDLELTDKSVQEIVKEKWLSQIETVYLVGHGTSLASAMSSEMWYGHIAKVTARAVPAFCFYSYIEDYLICPEKTLVIGMSTGGNTVSVVRSLKAAKERGAFTICITGTGTAVCADAADYRILTNEQDDRGEDVTAYTISHIFAMLANFRLAVALGKQKGKLDAVGEKYWDDQLDLVISHTKDMRNLMEQVKGAASCMSKYGKEKFTIIGSGPNNGTVQEGFLKISEFCWMFGTGMDLEEFAHGHFRSVGSEEPLLILAPSERLYQKTMDILAGCSVSKTPTVVFTANPTVAMEKLATYVVRMPSIDEEYMTPFLYVIPLWFYGYAIRDDEGRIVGEIRHGLRAKDIDFEAHFDGSGERL